MSVSTAFSDVASVNRRAAIRDLDESSVLHAENGYLIGNKDYFDDMLKLKQTVQLNPP